MHKVKITHLLDNGDKLEYETYLDADSSDEALSKATSQMQTMIESLHGQTFSIDKFKIESGMGH